MYSTDESESRALQDRTNAELIQQFESGTRSNTGSTASTYAQYLRTGLRGFERAHGFEPHLIQLANDPDLAARFLALTLRRRGQGELGRRTVGQRRKALAAFAAWLPKSERTRSEMARRQARERSSIRRGVKLITPGKAPTREPSEIPDDSDVKAVIKALLGDGREESKRTAELLTFLDLTGMRLGAALALKHGDKIAVGDGYDWFAVHEKSRPDRRPVRSTEGIDATVPTEGGADQFLWAVGAGVLNPGAVRRSLRAACDAAGVPRFNPHALRHRHAHRNAEFFDLPDLMAEVGWLSKAMAEYYADHEAIS